MCGIAGIVSIKNPHSDDKAIRSMSDSMAHRGPDADGFYINGRIAFGHRRLSIIDLSEQANQPIFDTTGNYAIVFNGEIYNYAELKKELNGLYPFKTNGDTEVVLAAFIHWGVKALDKLKGMFAFAIWNLKEETLFLARDRLGVKPVYMAKTDNHFIFASEIRAILNSGLVKRKLDQNSLTDYFLYQSFQSPSTIVQGIEELPGGHYIRISKGNYEQLPYWRLTGAPSFEVGSSEKVRDRVRQLLIQSVQRRMVSDVPVAAFLSGGIDSSVVVGLMAEVASAPETFNISFDDKDFDESKYASLIAKKFNTRHHELRLSPEDFLQELPNALNAMDSPSGDGVNTYVVSKAIRKQGIKVALSGVGGDELFAGYPIFAQFESLMNKKGWWNLPSFLRTIASKMIDGDDIRRQRLASLIRMNQCSIATIYPILRQVNAVKTLQQLLTSPSKQSQLQKSLSGLQENIQGFPYYSQVSIAEYLGYTGQTLLKDTDQMSMAVSLEVREPFFDHELIEYLLRIPDSFKKGVNPKSLLIAATGDLIPPEIYNRPKKGFVFPWNKWFRNELKSYCESRIFQLAQNDIFRGEEIKRYWQDFMEGKNRIGWTNILLLVALENFIEKHSLQ